MNPRDFFHKKINLKHFFHSISQWQEFYWACEDELKKPEVSARDVEQIYKNMNAIAEDVARFILDRHMSVEILNNELIGQKLKEES